MGALYSCEGVLVHVQLHAFELCTAPQVGVEPAPKMFVTDAYIEAINRQIRHKASRGSKRRSSAVRMFPAQRSSSTPHISPLAAGSYVSDADFFVRWGHTVRGVFIPTLRHTFKSRELEKLYQQHLSDQRRSSLAVTNIIDAAAKLHVLVLYLALAPEASPEGHLRGWLTGLFMALAVTLCAVVLTCKASMSPRWLRYAGLASWLSQSAQALGGLVYGMERDPSWYVLFTLFATYTLLPLPLLWALCAGALTSGLHLGAEAAQCYHDAGLLRKVGSSEGTAVVFWCFLSSLSLRLRLSYGSTLTQRKGVYGPRYVLADPPCVHRKGPDARLPKKWYPCVEATQQQSVRVVIALRRRGTVSEP